MPAWAAEVHAGWQQLLDRLAHAPESATRALDAPMKLAVFKHHAKRRGFGWSEIAEWNPVVNALHATTALTGGAPQGPDASPPLGPRSPFADRIGSLRPFMRKRGLSWDRLDAFLELRAELQEIDTRWTQLGPKGIFGRMEATSPEALDHAVPGVDRIEDATVGPPPDTRAAVRGAHVKDLARRDQGTFGCSWECIWDHGRHRVLNMANDPFATSAQWESAVEEDLLERLLDLPAGGNLLWLHLERLRRLRDSRRGRAEEAGTPGMTA
jgi:hypothetical protein